MASIADYRNRIGRHHIKQSNSKLKKHLFAGKPTFHKQWHTKENYAETLSKIKQVGGPITDAFSLSEVVRNSVAPLPVTIAMVLALLSNWKPQLGGNRSLNTGNTTAAVAPNTDDTGLLATTVTPAPYIQPYQTGDNKRLRRDVWATFKPSWTKKPKPRRRKGDHHEIEEVFSGEKNTGVDQAALNHRFSDPWDEESEEVSGVETGETKGNIGDETRGKTRGDSRVNSRVDSGVDSGEETGVDSGVDSGEETGVYSREETGVDSGVTQSVTPDSGEETEVDSGEGTGVDSGEETSVTQKATQRVTVTQKATQRVTQVTPSVIQKATKRVTQVTPSVIQKATKRVSRVTPSVTQKVTPRVTQKVTPRVTQKVTPRVTQKVTPRVTQKVTPRVTQKVTPRVTQKVTPRVTQKVTPRVKPGVRPGVRPEVNASYEGGSVEDYELDPKVDSDEDEELDCHINEELDPFIALPFGKAIWDIVYYGYPEKYNIDQCGSRLETIAQAHTVALTYEIVRLLYGPRAFEDIPNIRAVLAPVVHLIYKGFLNVDLQFYKDHSSVAKDIAEILMQTSDRPGKNDGCTLVNDSFKLPRGLRFSKNRLQVFIGGAYKDVKCENQDCMARYGRRWRPITYAQDLRQWFWAKDSLTAELQGKIVRAKPVNETEQIYRLIEDDGKLYFMARSKKLIPMELIKESANTWKVKLPPCTKKPDLNYFSLVEQEGFCNKLYVVSKELPDDVLKRGFAQLGDFSRIPKMIRGKALVASETKDGALRLLGRYDDTYHLYEIDARQIPGVSLLKNIEMNSYNMAKFLEIPYNKKVNWQQATDGAVYIAETHIPERDVEPGLINHIGSNLSLKKEIPSNATGYW